MGKFKVERPNVVRRYMHFLHYFRKRDFPKFIGEHESMFRDAKKSGDHSKVTSHFYDMMCPIIEMEYGSCWHFAPLDHPGQSREESVLELHQRIARLLQIGPGKRCLDVGCGVGGIMHDIIPYCGAHITGMALSEEEVKIGNDLLKNRGLSSQGQLVRGDAQNMPFEDSSFDAVYAIYSMKYFTTLDRVFGQVFKVLKPGGLFLVYAMAKTDKYDSSNKDHCKIIEGFEYSCGIPALHNPAGFIAAGKRIGLECVTNMDLSEAAMLPWYHEFDSPVMRMCMENSAVKLAISACETLRILPKGMGEFLHTFIHNNALSLPNAGKMGILTGSLILVFRKPLLE